MSQPNWKLIAQLGDKNPIEYGGYFIYEDTTGVYGNEAEYLLSPPEHMIDNDQSRWMVYRILLEQCTYKNGILSDNNFHPEHPAWWASKITEIASVTDMNPKKLCRFFCSNDPLERAHAYRALGEVQGFVNLDESPLSLTYTEVVNRYKED